MIFVIENNGYGLSTPVNEQYRCESLVDKAKGYGMEGVRIDGNNILTVLDTIKGVREYCIKEQKPYLIECMTFRMRGHEEASGTKYVPKQLFEEWAAKDPISNYENYLLKENILSLGTIDAIREEYKRYIEEELKIAFAAEGIVPDTQEEMDDVYACRSVPPRALSDQNVVRDLRMIDAIKEGLHQSMQEHSNLVLMGQDIAEYGGAFKITEGFVNEFGKERVRNTPLCESAIVGTSLGLSLEGYKSMMEMQFADFVTVASTR